jgi:hypothetical protein
MVLRREVAGLRRMTDASRQARLASEDFKAAYTPAEREMLSDLAENYPFISR